MLISLLLYGAAALSVLLSLLILFRPSQVYREDDTIQARKLINLAIKRDPRLGWSALKIAEGIKSGKFTSQEIVKVFIDHIRDINLHINAVCDERFDEALAEAAAVDELVRASKRDPAAKKRLSEQLFLGVPFIGKECHEFTGLRYTGGILSRQHLVGEMIQPAVARVIINGGAIMLGTGNTSEACMWYESNNPVYGRTKNPYDLSRTVGGSSGGTAALVSSLASPFGITSDVGGSTRIPAFFNGLFGHKPTGGSVPNFRTVPEVHGKVHRFCQLGPSCRHPEDLMPLLKLMSGPLGEKEAKYAGEKIAENKFYENYHWKMPEEISIPKLKVIVVWDQPGSKFPVSRRHKALVEAQDRVVQAFEKVGCRVETESFAHFGLAFDIWTEMLQYEQTHEFAEVLSDQKPETIWPVYEFLKWVFTMGTLSNHTLPSLGLAVVDRVIRSFNLSDEKTRRKGLELKQQLKEALQGDTIMIFPTLPQPAPKHGPLPLLFRFADAGATGIFNVLEFPATAVPTGLTSDGLPTGIQIVADHGNDDFTIAAATFLKQAGVAGWVPPLKQN